MSLFGGRKRLPSNLAPLFEEFGAALERVEAAKEAVLRAVPVARDPGVPLADALFAFERELGVAKAALGGWRTEELADCWDECASGIDDALAASAALRETAPDLDFEALLEAVTYLVAPLEPFEAASERFDRLRVRG